MGDDQAEMAKIKAHSTVGQAIDIGRRFVHAIRTVCDHLQRMTRQQYECGEDSSNSLFCSLPKDAPSNRGP